jgi:sugar/nucleoside kinase (ribokinase family)
MEHSRQSATARKASPPAICTIGDLILDVVVVPDAPLTRDGDTPAAIRLGAGGQAANVAAWARALGARSRLICMRGTDMAAELATADLTRYGVEICGPRTEGRGGVVVSVRGPDGERTMASDRGVAALLDPSALEPSWVQSCEVLHVSGYCLLREPMAAAAIAAASLAHRVTVDLASAHDIAQLGAGTFTERLRALGPDLVFATEAERAAVPGFDATWVVKLGARGAIFPEGHVPAPAVTAIDTTGAGDALAAGYLVGGPSAAIDAATRSVQLVGAMPAPPPDQDDRTGSPAARQA